MDVVERLRALREQLRSSLWFLPTVAVLFSVALGLVLLRVEVPDEGMAASVLFGAGVQGARSVLEVITGSVMTVVSVTFSLTILALVNTSNQYSPRVLTTFLRDRAPQVVLSTFLATFAYGVIVLRTIGSPTNQVSGVTAVPRLAVTVAVLFAFASLAAFVYFIHHISQAIRVESILNGVCRDTLAAMSGLKPRGASTIRRLPELPAAARIVVAERSGYVQGLLPRHIVKAASDADVVVRLRHPTGAYVTEGTILAWAWSSAGREIDVEAISSAANAAVVVGGERTLEQDIAFGIRQLSDIALRALSPGVNDPTTATDALGRIGVVLAALTQQELGPWTFSDGEGAPRVAVPARDLADYLDIVVPQILIYGAEDPMAMSGLLQLLEDVGTSSSDAHERGVVRRYLRACSSAARKNIAGEAARSMVAAKITAAFATLDHAPGRPPLQSSDT